MVAYTDFDDRRTFIETWLFTFVMLLRAGSLKFQPYTKEEDDFNFDNFWRKLFKSRVDEEVINECIQGVVEWITDFDPHNPTEDAWITPDEKIGNRAACIDGFISALWYYHPPDMDKYPAILLFVDLFLEGAKYRCVWDRLKLDEYTYAAPPWNKFMSSLGEEYYRSLELPVNYGYDPEKGDTEVDEKVMPMASTRSTSTSIVGVEPKERRTQESLGHPVHKRPSICSFNAPEKAQDTTDTRSTHSAHIKEKAHLPAATVRVEPGHLVVDIEIPEQGIGQEEGVSSDRTLKTDLGSS